MRILLTGSTGMLGGTILRTLSSISGLQLVGVARHPVNFSFPFFRQHCGDLTDPRTLNELGGESFDWILHTAANVNIDACERDREGTHRLHVDVTASLVKRFPQANFVYISTDAVFEGSHAPYAETSPTGPLNYYSISKLEGESAAAAAKSHHILRLSIFGFHEPEFRGSLVEWALKSWQANQPTPGFQDISFNPLYCGTVAGILRDAILDRSPLPQGILHLGSAHSRSKFQFLQLLAETLGYDANLVVPALFTERKAPGAQVTRPSNITLLTKRALAHSLPVPSLEDEIRKLAADLKSNRIQLHESGI